MPIRKSKVITRLATVVTATAMVVPLMSVVGASSANANATRTPNQAAFPHSDTLYTSGTAYSPPTNFNPNDPGALYTGTNGLLYESLFLYDPIHNKYIPWLASSGTWSGDTYIIHVRNGVDWVSSPSQSVVGALTGADVVFTINMEKADAAAAFNSNMSSVKSATANGNTVTVTFNGTPDYTAWQEFLWKGAIFPQSVFASETPAEQVTGNNATPVSTGPMTLDTTSATQACFETNPHWWGTAALGLSFKFKYLCDSVNGSNNVELSALLSNDLDWSNNFLPGINTLKVDRWRQLPADLLPQVPLHAFGQHRVARAEHHQGPDEQRQLPQGIGVRDQPGGCRERRLQRHREGGQPDWADAQPGQLHQLQRGQAVRL